LSKASLADDEDNQDDAAILAEPVDLNRDNREGLLKILTKVIGADVTAITIPVSVCEPTSFLMRLAEAVQYHDLLDKAAESEDPAERLTWVTVFALSIYISNERASKPFNPVLGETYEFTQPEKKYSFFAEQVSHHPPIGACIAENEHWKFWQSQSLKTKFTGNALECQGLGVSHVQFKKSGDFYSWEPVKTIVHNLILGKLWVDNFGDLVVNSKTHGTKSTVNLKQCGWFSKGWRELEGDVLDAKGHSVVRLTGKWTESIFAKPADAKKHYKFLPKNHDEPLWTPTNKPLPLTDVPSRYATDFTPYTLQLIKLDDKQKSELPPTDARLRTDRIALEKGDTSTAGAQKHAIEEKQRAARRDREAKGITYVPKYFKKSTNDDGKEVWEYMGGYWESRGQK